MSENVVKDDEFSYSLISEAYKKGIKSAELNNYSNAVEYFGESIYVAIQLVLSESYKGDFSKLKPETIVELCNYHTFIFLESNEKEAIIRSIDNNVIDYTLNDYNVLSSIIEKMYNWFEDNNRKNPFMLEN